MPQIEHEFMWVFQAVLHSIELPFRFDENVSLEKLDTRALLEHEIFRDELSRTEKNAWEDHMGNYVCIRASRTLDHAVDGEEDHELRQLLDHAYTSLRFVYPASFQNVTSIRCEGWKFYKNIETGEYQMAYKERDDEGFDYWSVGFNGFREHDFKFFPEKSVLTMYALNRAKSLYKKWIPESWEKADTHLRVATNHLHSGIKDYRLFQRYMACFVTLETLFSSYAEYLKHPPKPLFEKIITPRLHSLLDGKLDSTFYETGILDNLYKWRGVIAHRGTASFVDKEDVDSAMRPDRKNLDWMLGSIEIIARQSVINAWLDYDLYEESVVKQMQ